MPGKESPRCAYCGQTATTEDHVVPRGLWDGPQPNHVIKVPACRACNESFTLDEEYFRSVVISMEKVDQHPEAKRLIEGAFSRSLRRRPHLIDTFLPNLGVRKTITQSGVFSGWNPTFEVDRLRFDRVIAKIARGIFFKDYGERIDPSLVVAVCPDNPFEHEKIVQLIEQMPPYESLGDDVFCCRRSYSGKIRGMGAWLMVFYKAVGVFAWSTPPVELKSST